jgi:hypothetical protein
MSLYDSDNSRLIWERIQNPESIRVTGAVEAGVVRAPIVPVGHCWVVLAASLHLQEGKSAVLWISRGNVALTVPIELEPGIPAPLGQAFALPQGERLVGRSSPVPSAGRLVLRVKYLDIDPSKDHYLPGTYVP